MTKKLLITCKNLSKAFPGLDEEIINKLNLNINEGDHSAIVGVSGSGKSTLLHLMAGLEKASSGQVKILDQDIASLTQDDLGILRNTHLGFVYQFHHLLDELTAIENVALPLRIRGLDQAASHAQAKILLDAVGLGQRLMHTPAELSGGERQRVAVARALVGKPDCVLADEPTGNLDSETADRVFDLMLDIARQQGTAFLIVTHDPIRAKRCDRILHLERGVLKPFAG